MRQLLRVIAIVLPLVAGLLRNERRRDDVTVVAPLRERPLQHVTRATRFVARADLARRGEARKIPAQDLAIVGHFIDPAWDRRCGRQHGNRDGLLVHIEADVQTALRRWMLHRSRHGLALLVM